MTDGERIAKVLARAGIASRRAAERMIAEGRVAVNGRTIDSPALNVTATDRIAVDGKPLAPPDRPRLWLYHKPAGLVTSASDEKGRQTVFDTLPPDMPRVMSVGRLDLNSEGLLLLTNDGDVLHGLTHPSREVEREYVAHVVGPLERDLPERLQKGVRLEDGMARAIRASIEDAGPQGRVRLVLAEGRKREVRRMLEAVDHPVRGLERVRFGPIRLGDLPRGRWRELRNDEIRALRQAAAEPEGD